MIISIRKWVGNLLFLIVFVICTLCLFSGYHWIIDMVAPVDPYQVPKGTSVKVFHIHTTPPESGSIAERLRWFYWYGE